MQSQRMGAVIMPSPRVMITTYHQAFFVRGGGEYEMFSVADSLKRKGLIADIYGPYSRPLDSYDVVLHFSVHGGGLELLKEINSAGIPIVLWPNLWMRNNSNVPFDLVNSHIELANTVLFKSAAEEMHFRRFFSLPPEKTHRVTAGADAAYLRRAPEGLFKGLYGLVDDYAIWFGVIEPNKNQLAAIRVLRDKGIPLVLVGKHRDKQYYAQCREAAGEGVLFIDGLPQKSEIVRSALQDALFYIEVSHEPPGLSAIEAGLSGCKLLLSDSAWAREHFGDLALYANPSSDEDIAQAVDATMAQAHDASELTDRLKKLCLPDAIDPLIDILRSVVK